MEQPFERKYPILIALANDVIQERFDTEVQRLSEKYPELQGSMRLKELAAAYIALLAYDEYGRVESDEIRQMELSGVYDEELNTFYGKITDLSFSGVLAESSGSCMLWKDIDALTFIINKRSIPLDDALDVLVTGMIPMRAKAE